MKVEFEISEDVLNNTYDSYSNVFIIETIKDLVMDDKMIGIIRYPIKINENRKYLKKNQFVQFPESRIKWRSNIKNRHFIVVVNAQWVTQYTHEPKMPMNVPVLVSKLLIDDSGNESRVYQKEYIEMQLTYNQYIRKRVIIDFYDRPYGLLMAYENYKQQLKRYNDYYRALNETARNYLIEHDKLKSFISEVNHAKKKYKKEWNEAKIRYYETERTQRAVEEFMLSKAEKKGKLVNFDDLRY